MKISKVETIWCAAGASPALTFVRLHTDGGVVGLGETYYTPLSVASYVHEVLAPYVIGRDVLRDGSIWEELYAQSARRGAGGTDMRALSAVDLAVWDLRGKLLDVPVYVLLGGNDKPSGVRMYNTCAGRTYAAAPAVGRGESAEHDDLWRWRHAPAELAAELRDEGFAGMKVWPFDEAAAEDQGRRISAGALRAGTAILEAIRGAVGGDLELMLEGHGQWQIEPAAQILRAVEPLSLQWAEDMILAHDPEALRTLAARTSVPIAASEYLMGRWQYRAVLSSQSISYLHLDPTWCGGITEAQRILALASSFGVVCSMHDCTGPMNLLAGLHLASANRIVGYQEVVRGFLSDLYPEMVDTTWLRRDGRMIVPDAPGLGGELSDRYLARPDLIRSVTE
ncbi:mandelate racemase/muconate lactonizing enzyme family protein [Planosporangium thailandense]|uniref:Mandelate racemase/muconate lactonizing enzyme family protein n=1 Tax=Planosporangium thailandense TaxID=765197 RepID=A0ABX0Y695_9ACTN|nr:mandelate racemase/muconate lactonizing enzyme family protein [Planosporangium thailandense]NJC72950.1 mandelate racemase/muconate lactonizing enzyme family protein [Planosporangium thailandense]